MTARRLIALLSALCLLPVLAVTTATGTASAADDAALFKPLPSLSLSALEDPTVRPSQFQAYRVDLAGLRSSLSSGRARLTIPDPAGTPTEFAVVEDSVMQPELQSAHPDIRTYAGATDNGTSIRLDVTPFGFHAMVIRPDGDLLTGSVATSFCSSREFVLCDFQNCGFQTPPALLATDEETRVVYDRQMTHQPLHAHSFCSTAGRFVPRSFGRRRTRP